MKVTRAMQVLARLREAHGLWVDGTELATERVGGSEGLKRLRELRATGYTIEERRHPEGFSRWQYRLIEQTPTAPAPLPTPALTLPHEGVSPMLPGEPRSPAPEYHCPKPDCSLGLYAIRFALGGFVEGRCAKHGTQQVKA